MSREKRVNEKKREGFATWKGKYPKGGKKALRKEPNKEG